MVINQRIITNIFLLVIARAMSEALVPARIKSVEGVPDRTSSRDECDEISERERRAEAEGAIETIKYKRNCRHLRTVLQSVPKKKSIESRKNGG